MDTDEFEFRPITEGLGFHRKAASLKGDKGESRTQVLESIKSPIQEAASLSAALGLDLTEVETGAGGSASDAAKASRSPATKSNFGKTGIAARPESSSLIPSRSDSNKSITWTEPVVRKPLPRPGDDRKAAPVHSTMAVSSAVARAASALSGAPAAHQPAVTRNTATTAAGIEAMVKQNSRHLVFSWSAAIVDGVMVAAISLLFLVSLLLITDVDLMGLLVHPELNFIAFSCLAVLLLAVTQIYMVGARGWAGATLGDWAFDIEVGNYLERSSLTFPLKLMFRSLLYTVTGFVLIPLFSTLFRKDISGDVTGLTLQARG